MKSVQFCVDAPAEFGQAVYMVHSQNNWQINQSFRMSWVSGKKWMIDFNLLQPYIEYKYVISDFELTNKSVLTWEKGPNRILWASKSKRLNKSQQCSIWLEEKWERRRIIISHPQLLDNTSMFVIGDSFSKKMKLLTFRGQKYFCSSFELDLAKENQSLNFQCYLLHYGKQPKEYISCWLFMPASLDSVYPLDEVPFFQISNM